MSDPLRVTPTEPPSMCVLVDGNFPVTLKPSGSRGDRVDVIFTRRVPMDLEECGPTSAYLVGLRVESYSASLFRTQDLYVDGWETIAEVTVNAGQAAVMHCNLAPPGWRGRRATVAAADDPCDAARHQTERGRAMTEATEPVADIDIRTGFLRRVSVATFNDLQAWLRAENIPALRTIGIQIFDSDGEITARVTERWQEEARDCALHHDHNTSMRHCEQPLHIRDIRLTSLPPESVLSEARPPVLDIAFVDRQLLAISEQLLHLHFAVLCDCPDDGCPNLSCARCEEAWPCAEGAAAKRLVEARRRLGAVAA